MSLKEKILELRRKGKNYNQIKSELHCSVATISYHCKRNGIGNEINDISVISNNNKLIDKINKFYKNHTAKETSTHFKISESSVKRYVDNKHILLTEEQRKKNNYNRVKNRRQKLKSEAIKYKGGKCEKCGYDKCEWALDFHHTNSKEKEFTISRYCTLSWEKLKIELDKCIMLCANCHREKHFEEFYEKSLCTSTS